MEHKIIFSTSEDMSKINNDSVKLMITSPPYGDLKNYETEGQIGYKESYEKYLDRLNKVWKETFRVLVNGGTCIININTRTINGKALLIPYDFIKQLTEIGFVFRDMHYWHKSSGIPRINNLGDHFEYFIIFTKGDNVNINEISFFDYKIDNVNIKSNIWNINKKFGSVGKKYMVHPAIFPLDYIKRMIQVFTQPKDLVLDPFLGSGTSLLASMLTDRSFIGYELNKEGYLPMIIDRLNEFNLSEDMVNFI